MFLEPFWITLILTCHTPTTAFAIKISKITNGSTNASTPSCSSKRANTCEWNGWDDALMNYNYTSQLITPRRRTFFNYANRGNIYSSFQDRPRLGGDFSACGLGHQHGQWNINRRKEKQRLSRMAKHPAVADNYNNRSKRTDVDLFFLAGERNRARGRKTQRRDICSGWEVCEERTRSWSELNESFLFNSICLFLISKHIIKIVYSNLDIGCSGLEEKLLRENSLPMIRPVI